MKVVTLCGSARFEQDFIDANRELTLRGFVVISMSVLPSQAPNGAGKAWYTPAQKVVLDLVHLEKITMADAILVVGDGYVGESTGREIAWAALQGVPAVYQNSPVADWDYLAEMLHIEIP